MSAARRQADRTSRGRGLDDQRRRRVGEVQSSPDGARDRQAAGRPSRRRRRVARRSPPSRWSRQRGPRRGGVRRLARRRRGERGADPPPDPRPRARRAADRAPRRLPRRARAVAARQAARARRAQGAAGDFSDPIRADSDDELGQLAAAFDDMQRQLARLDTARKQFIATASHELRTPIFSLGGFLELLEDEELDEDTRRAVPRQCAARSSGCASSRRSCSTSRGSSPARWSCGPSRPTWASSRARSRRSSARRRAPTRARAAPREPLEVECDPERVAQVLRILLDNALVHTPTGPASAFRPRARTGMSARGRGLRPRDQAPAHAAHLRAVLHLRRRRRAPASAWRSRASWPSA